MKKSVLRQFYLDKRKELLNSEALRLKSLLLYRRLFNFIKIQPLICNYHIFLTIKKFNEINTTPIINFLYKNHKKIFTSRTDFKTHKMTTVPLTPNSIIIQKNNIPQPKESIFFQEKKNIHLDAIIIPLLAFDKFGNRIGYGKGFYDSFLKKCKKNVLKIGVSLFKPEPFIQSESHDVKLNYCITPFKTYKF